MSSVHFFEMMSTVCAMEHSLCMVSFQILSSIYTFVSIL